MNDAISIIAEYLLDDRLSFINASCVCKLWRSVFMDRVYLLPLRVLDLILFLERNDNLVNRQIFLANEVGYYLDYWDDTMTFSHEKWQNKPINIDHYTTFRTKLLPFLIQYVEAYIIEPCVRIEVYMKCLKYRGLQFKDYSIECKVKNHILHKIHYCFNTITKLSTWDTPETTAQVFLYNIFELSYNLKGLKYIEQEAFIKNEWKIYVDTPDEQKFDYFVELSSGTLDSVIHKKKN